MGIVTGYLHTYEEALLIVHALRLGFIEPKKERLSLREREHIRSGNIYIFIERKTHIMRWTDGMTWSPSKILGSFLLYKEVPRFLTKNASKKLSNRKIPRQKCTPLEKQLQKDQFYMHKKTISLTHGEETYHVIAYFQPVFDKRGILELPFFISLQKAILKYPELSDDSFVQNLLEKKINFIDQYSILEFNDQTLSPVLDREQLVKDAISLLSSKFDFKI